MTHSSNWIQTCISNPTFNNGVKTDHLWTSSKILKSLFKKICNFSWNFRKFQFKISDAIPRFKKFLKCQIQIQSFISWLHNHNLKLFLRPKTRFFLAFHFSVTNSIFSWWQTSHRISCWQKLVNKFRFRNVDGCSGRNVWLASV